MRLKRFFEADDAVSPVIGVILMVAITVILAAVIATFVLGLGEQVSDTAPQASFSYDYNETASPSGDFNNPGGDAELTIQHSGGPSIPAEQLSLAGDIGSDEDFTDNGFDTMTAGDRVVVAMNSTDSISIIWTSQDGSTSATLSNYDGPDA